MVKLKIIKMIFLSFILSSTGHVSAFNDDYESIDSRMKRGLESLRDIYNSPASLCRKDRIKNQHCGKISILFGGDTFKDVYYDETLSKKSTHGFQNQTESEVQSAKSYYLIPSYLDKTWNYPTMGQLLYAMDEGYVDKFEGHPYWFWDTNDKKLAKAYYKRKPSSDFSKAMLTRLVTDDFPSKCAQSDCPDFLSLVDWRLQLDSGSAFTIQFEFGYMHNGEATHARGSGRKTFTIPALATGVWLHMWHTGQIGYAAKWGDLEDQVGSSTILCAKILGSLAVSSGQLLRHACY